MSKGQKNVATTRKVEVFRPGTFKAMNGQEYAFTEADVSAMASTYNAETSPAPVVVGHPKHDDPAFGWVKGFEVNEAGTLVAELENLAPEFVSAVEDGRYRKVSMKFFAPDASNNPSQGSYYPRHLGFLGGAAPAVSGLAPVQFAEAEGDELIEIEVSFAEPAMEDVASLFRSLREFIIDKFSKEEADEAVPNYLIRWVDDAADEPANSPGFSQPSKEDPPMAGDDTQLKAREADLAKRELALHHSENVSFAEGLISDNKLLPVNKDSVVALLDQLAVDGDAEIAFSDDGTDKKVGAGQLLKDILSAQPEVVPTGKTDLGDDASGNAPAFAAPDGMSVDSDDLQLHAKAVAFQNQNPGTDYLVAVQAVQEG
ncbi:hypothetical protein [Planktotalea sp.]|uniref:hypothetical protein n=1 Tax=Planktotalea sp. TaxID=2029877 RepID=UPI003D6A775B